MANIENIYDHPNYYSLDDFPSEVWLLVPGTEARYFVSNLGRIKIPLEQRAKKSRGPRTRHLRICRIRDSRGYKKIMIDGKMRFCHHMVAFAFIGEKPTDKHQVNHKDGNKWNNRPSNLEWITASQNIKHSYDTGLNKGVRGIDKLESKPVAKHRMDGSLVCVYGSTHTASKETGILRSGMVRALTGRRGVLTAGGFVWKYITKEEYFILKEKLEREAQPIQAGSV